MRKKFVKDYLTFSKKDRILIIALVCIFGLITIIPRTPFFKPKPHSSDIVGLPEETKKQKEGTDESAENRNHTDIKSLNVSSSPSATLFYFDPNYISQEEWALLGVNKRTSASIKKYLEKGGSFKKPDDLFKIYLLDKKIAKQLVPFVRFKRNEKSEPVSAVNGQKTKSDLPVFSPYPMKQYRKVRINEADTADFQTFPGIGSSLSNRIVKYRESLGGFISPLQVGEVYNLPDSVFQNIFPFLELDPTSIRKININTIMRQDLPKHPYLPFALSTAIIQYRDQHGRYERIEDLHKLHLMDDKIFNKIAPYITVE